MQRSLIYQESLPATTAFQGSNPEDCVQIALIECFRLSSIKKYPDQNRQSLPNLADLIQSESNMYLSSIELIGFRSTAS
jgi:hypothetical protein